MTKDEALKLALEALERTIETMELVDGENDCSKGIAAAEKAITAIKEALAQPEQEPVAWRWGVQKLKNGDFEWRYSLNQTRPDAIPLYTTPPQSEPVIDKSAAVRIATALGWEPKRTWRWLTDEEIYEAWDTIIEEPKQAIEFAYNIQAKLKEKNT